MAVALASINSVLVRPKPLTMFCNMKDALSPASLIQSQSLLNEGKKWLDAAFWLIFWWANKGEMVSKQAGKG